MLNPDNNLHIEPAAMLAIRRARVTDASQLSEMISALAAFHGDIATNSAVKVERDLFGDMPWATAFVAELGDELLGYALVVPLYRATEGERGIDLHQLYVKPEHRDRGIGHHLISKVKGFAASNACSHVTVAAATGNFRAYHFYEQNGFKPRPVTGMRYRINL